MALSSLPSPVVSMSDDDVSPAADAKGSKVAACGPTSFSLTDVRRAIPAHCFERSTITSSLYLAFDVALVVTLALLVHHVSAAVDRVAASVTSSVFSAVLRALPWLVYWSAQGTAMVAVWMVAHEAGHGAFSSSQLVNDFVGWVVHSALLVPYFAWQISHRKHHAHNGSLEDDYAFTPLLAEDINEPRKTATNNDDGALHVFAMQWTATLQLLAYIASTLAMGVPSYMLASGWGHRLHRKASIWSVSHFSSQTPLFSDVSSASYLIGLSNVGVAITLLAGAACSRQYGVANVISYYFIPWCIMNGWVTLITWLHHTDEAVPKYARGRWSWLDGQLATIDRSFGPVLDFLFHHIQDTHVLHHLFPTIPHYHAVEASRHILPVLGAHHLQSSTPVLEVLSHVAQRLRVVEPHSDMEGVYYMPERSMM